MARLIDAAGASAVATSCAECGAALPAESYGSSGRSRNRTARYCPGPKCRKAASRRRRVELSLSGSEVAWLSMVLDEAEERHTAFVGLGEVAPRAWRSMEELADRLREALPNVLPDSAPPEDTDPQGDLTRLRKCQCGGLYEPGLACDTCGLPYPFG